MTVQILEQRLRGGYAAEAQDKIRSEGGGRGLVPQCGVVAIDQCAPLVRAPPQLRQRVGKQGRTELQRQRSERLGQ
ncbi:MAG TPA: hypothetical protein VIH38_00185, partial [Steroidobacteraceae bacterium]